MHNIFNPNLKSRLRGRKSLKTLNVEKVEAEKLIDQFIHRYRIELNPLIGKILLLKKKINCKIGGHSVVY